MLGGTFLDSPVFTWIVTPLLIFVARILDVSLGTIRIMLLSRDKKFLPPVLAFFEVLIWLLAIRHIFNHLTNITCYFAFAGGFAMGNFVGILLEEKLAMGQEVVQVITKQEASELVDFLKATVLTRKGRQARSILFTQLSTGRTTERLLIPFTGLTPGLFILWRMSKP